MESILAGKKLTASRLKISAAPPEMSEHITAMGEVTFAWNQFQSALFAIFAALLGNQKLAHGLWHCIRSDGTQRDLLMAAADAKLAKKKVLLNQVTWLVDCGRRIATHRNDLTHTAMFAMPDPDLQKFKLVPDFLAGKPGSVARLQTTKPKDWLVVAGDLRALRAYALMLSVRIISKDRPASWSWPDRPKLRSIRANGANGNSRRRSRKKAARKPRQKA